MALPNLKSIAIANLVGALMKWSAPYLMLKIRALH